MSSIVTNLTRTVCLLIAVSTLCACNNPYKPAQGRRQLAYRDHRPNPNVRAIKNYFKPKVNQEEKSAAANIALHNKNCHTSNVYPFPRPHPMGDCLA